VEPGEPGRRGSFDRIAQRASYFSSSPLFFVICVAMVLAWLGGYVFGTGDAYEQAAGTALTATTLLLVALLKNAELRSEAAIQSKADALATGMLEAIRNEGQKADPRWARVSAASSARRCSAA
jgi:low affinity Fe/Cu permease